MFMNTYKRVYAFRMLDRRENCSDGEQTALMITGQMYGLK